MKRFQKLSCLMRNIVNLMETAISIALILVIIFLLIELFSEILPIFNANVAFSYNSFISKLLNLVIGIEFARMLCQHTMDSVIEVLFFAVARQIILAHTSSIDTLLGTMGIATLFAVRKHLLPRQTELHVNQRSIPEMDTDLIPQPTERE